MPSSRVVPSLLVKQPHEVALAASGQMLGFSSQCFRRRESSNLLEKLCVLLQTQQPEPDGSKASIPTEQARSACRVFVVIQGTRQKRQLLSVRAGRGASSGCLVSLSAGDNMATVW